MAASHNAMLGKECLSARLLEVIQWSFWEKSIKNEYTDFSNSIEVVWGSEFKGVIFCGWYFWLWEEKEQDVHL